LVKGFRRVLHVMPDNLSEDPLFRENIQKLGGTGLTFDLCVLPRQIDRAIALVDLAPDVQFILDHCGVPDIKAGALDEWRGKISDIAKRPNVTAKISGVVAYADTETWRVETLAPYVNHVIENFGWDRLVWGSDWPVCTLGGGLATWLAATHALLSGCSQEEKTKLFSGNARRIWNLK
jgi:predicted TIM-barrel fold metal-dependent hydrolase